MRQIMLAAGCALLGACRPAVSPDVHDVAADVAAIVQVNERMLAALNSGDWARLNELTDERYVAIIGGNAMRNACGRMMRRNASVGPMPSEYAASHWPFGIASSDAR